MNAEGLGETKLNYWLGRTVGESLDASQIRGDRCIRPDGATVDYLNDPTLLDIFKAKELFNRNSTDTLINNGHANPTKRFTAEIRRPEKLSCAASGPTPITAICRAVGAFAYRSVLCGSAAHRQPRLTVMSHILPADKI